MRALSTLFSLLLSVFFIFAGNSLFLNASNIALEQQVVPRILIGLLNTTYYFGAASSAVFAHRIVSRVGHTRSFSFFAAVMALTTLCYILTRDLLLWGSIRFIQGFCYYSVLMVIESWLNEKTEQSIRSRVLGLYEVFFYIAFSIGAVVLNFSNDFSQTCLFSTIFVVLAILPLSLTKIPAPLIPPPIKISMPSLFQLAPLALLGSLVGGFLANGFLSMNPSYTASLHFDVHKTSVFIIFALIGGFLVQLPIGKFSDTYGRRAAIITASSISCIAALGGFFLSWTSWYYLQYFFAAMFGFGAFCIYPLSAARANDVLPADSPNRLEISRSLLFAYGLGALIAPLTLGVSMQIAGSSGFELPFILLSFCLAFFAYRQTKEVPKESRDTYQHVTPAATHTLISEADSVKARETSELSTQEREVNLPTTTFFIYPPKSVHTFPNSEKNLQEVLHALKEKAKEDLLSPDDSISSATEQDEARP